MVQTIDMEEINRIHKRQLIMLDYACVKMSILAGYNVEQQQIVFSDQPKEKIMDTQKCQFSAREKFYLKM